MVIEDSDVVLWSVKELFEDSVFGDEVLLEKIRIGFGVREHTEEGLISKVLLEGDSVDLKDLKESLVFDWGLIWKILQGHK